MGLFTKKIQVKHWDRTNMKPVLRCSICTGEQVAGFRHMDTGRFEDIICIRKPEDLETFKSMYGIGDAEITKEW